MVYFARMPSGLIKIGFSRNVARRLGQLTGEYGAPVEIVGVLEGLKKREGEIHEIFAHLRTAGCEMFIETAEIRQFIRDETIRCSTKIRHGNCRFYNAGCASIRKRDLMKLAAIDAKGPWEPRRRENDSWDEATKRSLLCRAIIQNVVPITGNPQI